MEENFYTLCEVAWNVGFMNRQKSKFQTTKTWKICSHEAWYFRKIFSHEAWYPLIVDFTTRQNRIFETQKLRKLHPSLRCTLKRWFHESAEIEFSGCQNAEVWYMRKICTHEAWCRWNVHFTTAQKRIFRHEKWRKFPHSIRGTLKRWFHESAEIAFSGC